MARKKTLATDQAAPEVAEAGLETAEVTSPEDLALAVRTVRQITGFGQPEAQTRVSRMSAKTVARIAKLEREGRRPEIVKILYS